MSDYLEKLNPKQYEAVVNQGHPLLILAGAGSGKTRVITSKIAYLVEHCGALPSSILAVTFTNKAAGEMRDRVANFLGYTGDMKSYELPMIRTFHSFGAWMLRRNSEYAGLSPNFSIYDDSDMVSLLKSLEKAGSKRDIKLYANLISRAKDFGLTPYDDLTAVTFDPDFPAIYKAYQEKLDSIGNVDFGDLILRPVKLLKENSEIRERLSRKFQIILVDEYQDSNIAQFELLKLLAGDGRSLTVVGDDDQSIYKFRGAEVQNIIGFPEYFDGTKVIKLEQNYRSTAPILELAGAVVDKNKGRLGKTLWTARKGGQKPVLAYFNTAQEEAEYCASLVAKDTVETAILYRTNAQSRLFESVFTRLNIPYRIVGSLRFYEREEIKDTLAWMAFLVNPKDQVSFQRIINKPARGIGKATVDKILISAGGDIATRLKNYIASTKGKSKAGLEEFLEIYTQLSALLAQPDENLSGLINEILRSSGLLDHYKAEDKEERTYRVDNLIELSNAASEFPAGPEGITQFLENIELDSGASQTDENARVTLITMHNTKGLEFDRVIITGLEDELFPGRGADDEDEIEEERRIFYVSITRARDQLYMTSCRQRMIWGRSQFCSPSRFLDEIPPRLLDIRGGSAKKSIGTGYRVGEYVYRDDYGVGVVIKSWVEAGEPVVVVRFENGQFARFLTKYTKLEKITP